MAGVRKRGKKWYYFYNEPQPDGSNKKIERVGGLTKAEALEKRSEAIARLKTGYLDPGSLTVGDYLDDWVTKHVEKKLKISTIERYKTNIRLYIKPAVGRIKMNELAPIHVENMLLKAETCGLSGSSLQQVYGILNTALNKAVKLRIMYDNPCKYIDRPKRGKFIPTTLSVEEFKLIINDLDLNDYRDYIFFIILQVVLELGLRRGEIAGLEYADFDFNEKTVKINNNLIYVNGHTHMDKPKTDESQRTIPISDSLIKLIKDHRKVQLSDRLQYGPMYESNIYNNREFDFVFTWENGKNIHPLYFYRRFKELLKRNGIEKNVRFHDLRHTNATYLLMQGVDLKTIQERLGHAQFSTTADTYAHVTKKLQREATDKVSNLLQKAMK